MPTFYAKVVDEDGNEVPTGERGELCVKGPAVVKGYLNREEATAEAIVDGWFHTGDIVYMDEDGFVHIVDRAKDMVLRGGENVYCAEVEAAIYEHPAVAEAAVFGVPDDRLGETVGVAIHLVEGVSLTESGARRPSGTAPLEVQDPRARLVPRRAPPAERQRQVPEARPARRTRSRGVAELQATASAVAAVLHEGGTRRGTRATSAGSMSAMIVATSSGRGFEDFAEGIDDPRVAAVVEPTRRSRPG